MIRIGIAGYGNLGRGVESALSHTEDMELVGVFTRRSPDSVKTKTGVPVYSMEQAKNMTDKIDVMILCGGSANDLPKQTAELAQYFNVIDSFDTHAKIPEHFADVDAACKKSGHLGMISVGWDPGMFSLNRLYGQAILPNGKDYTFWGKGVSQGHSDAIRRIPGVQDARQYTIPVESALESVRRGENPELTTREKHTRECSMSCETARRPSQFSMPAPPAICRMSSKCRIARRCSAPVSRGRSRTRCALPAQPALQAMSSAITASTSCPRSATCSSSVIWQSTPPAKTIPLPACPCPAFIPAQRAAISAS